MSNPGKQPSVLSLNLTPQDDPANPRDGDIYYSDGSTRLEGPWVYQNGSWAQFSTGSAITIVDDLTLTPSATDPGSPTTGMMFYSDGTARAAGIWVYNGSGWVQVTGLRYQEFYRPASFTVRATHGSNRILASEVENGDTFGGVTLATNDIVLLSAQTTATENGVYTVNASGAPTRHGSYDTYTELNDAVILVSAGTFINTRYFQTATLASLATNQVWSTTPATKSFTVPAGVYNIRGLATGPGSGGSCGAIYTLGTNAVQGGMGGIGAVPSYFSIKTTPGDVLTLTLGKAANPAAASAASSSATGASSTIGTETTITGTGIALSFAAAPGVTGGTISGGTSATAAAWGVRGSFSANGAASVGGAPSYVPLAGSDGGDTSYAEGGAGGTGAVAPGVGPSAGNGGGGGASIAAGGAGAAGGSGAGIAASIGSDGSKGSGGGGSGASTANGGTKTNARGSIGGDGYVRISW